MDTGLWPVAAIEDGTAIFSTVFGLGNAGVISDGSDGTEILAPLGAIRVTPTSGPVIVEVLQQ